MDNLLRYDNTKNDIPLGHLDYDYVKQCKDGKELEKILKVLRSGSEGHYPDLERVTEARLTELKPHSKLLQAKVGFAPRLRDLDGDESKHLLDDLQKWNESVLHSSSDHASVSTAADAPIRSTGNIGAGKRGTGEVAATAKTTGASAAPVKTRSVKPRDYREWDKVDIDAELARLEEEEEGQGEKKKQKPQPQASHISNTRSSKLSTSVDTTGVSEMERDRRAEAEKVKGNEAFKSEDYEEAIVYYSRSLAWHTNVAAYNNRAQTYLKMKRWNEAMADCNKVLTLEPSNVKGKLRRASAHIGRGEHMLSLSDINDVLEVEPQNKQALEMKRDVEKVLEEQKVKGRRMVIEDVEGSSETEEEEIGVHGQGDSSTRNGHTHTANSAAKVTDQQSGTSSKSQKKRRKRKSKQQQQKAKPAECGNSSEASVESLNDDADDEYSGSRRPAASASGEKKLPPSLADVKSRNSFGALSQEDEGTVGNEAEVSSGVHQSLPGGEATVSTTEKFNQQSNAAVGGLSKQLAPAESPLHNAAPLATDMKPATNSVLPESVLPADVLALKDKGAQLFKAGQYGAASEVYTLAIDTLSLSKDKYVDGLCTLYNNRATCHLKVGDCGACVRDCSTVLHWQPQSDKALLRRATANEQLERFGAAYSDYQAVLTVCASCLPAQQGLARCMSALQRDHGNRWRDKVTGDKPSAGREDSEYIVAGELADKKKIFNQWKEEGNNHVKQGNYGAAEQCYTRCVSLCPDEMTALNNRALCYLKLNQPASTVSDCSRVLAMDSVNVKALFRRALAYKALEQFDESLHDLRRVLSLEPTNGTARKEIDDVTSLSVAAGKVRPSPPASTARQRIIIEQTDSSSDDEDERASSTGVKVAMKDKDVKTLANEKQGSAATAKSSPGTSAASQSSPAAAPFPSAVLPENKTAATTSQSVQPVTSCVESTKPLTAYEFTQAWLSLKHTQDVGPYAALLQRVKPDDLPKIVSNKLDSVMLLTLLNCIAHFADRGDVQLATDFLASLPGVPRFQTITMFMENSEKQVVKKTLETIVASSPQSNRSVLDHIRKSFGLP